MKKVVFPFEGLVFVIPGEAAGRDPESTPPPLDSRVRGNDENSPCLADAAHSTLLKHFVTFRCSANPDFTELRAVMSLVRLRQRRARHRAQRTAQHEAGGRLAEAHQMLSEIYGWFTEGFATKDLQEAKMLLAELAG